MLYDNARLACVYLHAWILTSERSQAVTGNEFFRTIIKKILDYVMREMTGPEGSFYSTQDADSEGPAERRTRWLPALPSRGPGSAGWATQGHHAPARSRSGRGTRRGLRLPQFHLPGAGHQTGGAGGFFKKEVSWRPLHHRLRGRADPELTIAQASCYTR
jgi:hypothetical protein